MPTGSLPEASWKGIMRQLYGQLQDNEDRLELLRQIDRTMTDYDLPMAEFLHGPLEGFARLSQASTAYFYIDSGDELLLLCATDSGNIAESIPLSTLSSILPSEEKEPQVFAKDKLTELGALFKNAACLFILPVWLPSDKAWPTDDKRFGVVILEDTRYEALATPFTDQSIQAFARAVIGQFGIGLRIQMKGWRSLWFENLVNSFFSFDLDPVLCFKELAEKIPDYLPRFGPFEFKSAPEVSVIIHGRGNNYLTMIAHTVKDSSEVKLKFNDSVVGFLFEDIDLPYILGNPRQDPKLMTRYKAYAEGMNTELAAPIKTFPNKSPIAVINLESRAEHAFKQLHVDALLYLCNILRPIITSLYDRIVERQLQQQSILYAQRSYWNTVGAILEHNTNSQLVSIRMGIDNARRAIELNKVEKADEILAQVPNNLETAKKEIKGFSNKLHEYTVYGRYFISEQISEALGKVEQMMARTKRQVQISISQSDEFEVFCSPILAMHLYNLLDNSVYWIYDRIRREPEHKGQISITVKPGPLPAENQEQELNRTCEIIIIDNGSGCPPETLTSLRRRPVTSQRKDGAGMGHAVYAATSYIQSLGGTIDIDSKVGEGFTIIMNLPLYNEKIHKPKAEGDIQT
ncbi:MAG: hypothetical protein KDJ52_05835 [Anaerolineae bacterium]|nr:hypothetical protein [Anaerolineae bacterium]